MREFRVRTLIESSKFQTFDGSVFDNEYLGGAGEGSELHNILKIRAERGNFDAMNEPTASTEQAPNPVGLASPNTMGSPSVSGDDKELRKSALQDNLERKGKNAYYFAHAHKANGPEWDGKVEPKLLSRHSSVEGHLVDAGTTAATFDYSKSNITTYSFLDDGSKVKLYIDMENVGELCSDDDVTLDYTSRSLSFTLQNYNAATAKSSTQILRFGKLTGDISNATFRLKKDKVILTLTKSDETKVWHTINDKGQPEHEVV